MLTVTLNPCIDLNLEVDDFDFAQPMRARRERKRAAGKGVNVAVALHLLGLEATAFAPLGGPSGREYIALAAAQGRALRLHPFPISGNTRTNIVITSRRDGRHLKINQSGPVLTDAEWEGIVVALKGMVRPGEAVALCGSLPPGAPPDGYAQLVRLLRHAGCFVALDADDAALRLGIAAGPDLVKPNREELERFSQGTLSSDTPIAEAPQWALRAGARICLLSDGPREACLASAAGVFTICPPRVNGSPVGAGDAMLAGFLAGLLRQGGNIFTVATDAATLRAAFHLAVACGCAAASTPDTEHFGQDGLSQMLAKIPMAEQVAKATVHP